MKRATISQEPLKSTNRTGESSSELQEEIRRRAHELYEQRGRTDGHEMDDWLQAETEFLTTKTKVA